MQHTLNLAICKRTARNVDVTNRTAPYYHSILAIASYYVLACSVLSWQRGEYAMCVSSCHTYVCVCMCVRVRVVLFVAMQLESGEANDMARHCRDVRIERVGLLHVCKPRSGTSRLLSVKTAEDEARVLQASLVIARQLPGFRYVDSWGSWVPEPERT